MALRPGSGCENLAHVRCQGRAFILKCPQRCLNVGSLKGLAFIVVRKLKHLETRLFILKRKSPYSAFLRKNTTPFAERQRLTPRHITTSRPTITFQYLFTSLWRSSDGNRKRAR